MKNIHNLCLPEIKEYSAKEIVDTRAKYSLSQAALASIFNISVSTVQKWEQGGKKLKFCFTKTVRYYRS